MSPAVTILLITIGSATHGGADATSDPFTPAIARATREALGPETQIVLKEVETAPYDEAATELGVQVHADAVVEVEWSLPDHLHTRVRLRRAGAARWFDRDVGFRSVDEPAERSRTVGFAIASMLPEYAARTESPRPDASPVPPAQTKPAAAPKRGATPTPAVEPRGHRNEPQSQRQDDAAPDRPRSTTEHETPLHHPTSVSLRAIAAVGVGDPGTALGGAFDFRHELFSALALRVGVSARVGIGSQSEIGTRFFEGQMGVVWRAWTSANGRGSIGGRLDALLTVAQFTFDSSSSGEVNKEKTLPGGDAVLEAGYFLTPALALVAGAGVEVLFGKTDVFVGAERRTSLSPVHPVFDAGISIGF